MTVRFVSAIAVLVLVTACQGATTMSTAGDGATPSATVTARTAPAATEQTATAPPAASESPQPSAQSTASPPAALSPDTVVTTTVEKVSLRRTPGMDGERMGFLELGTVAFVLAGPQEMNGMPWYRVSGMGVPYASGCATAPPDDVISCPSFHGWVAGANEAGHEWLAPADLPCPEATIRGISESGYTWRLVCWADEPITFDAWWPEIPEDAGLGGFCPQAEQPGAWLYCQQTNFNGLNAAPDEGFVNRLHLSLDPASGVTMPERGQWVRVTGRFDHPSAALCRDIEEGEGPDSAEFGCRLQFVPISVEALGT